MSRELKRVPLDFDYPLKVIWVGYKNPFYWNEPKLDENIKEKYSELFKKIEPPNGKGYQLWENCSEGSPISPVFETLEKLCEWAEKFATTFGGFTATKEEWKEMLLKDFVHHRESNMIFM